MADQKRLIIVGCGGCGIEGLWAAEVINEVNRQAPPWEILGFVDDNPQTWGQVIYGHKVLGSAKTIATTLTGTIYWFPGLGEPRVRAKVADRIADLPGWEPATLIHPSVVVGKEVTFGRGVYVGPLSVVAPCATLGDFVSVNASAGIGHHVVMEPFSHVYPGARVNGNCRVERFARIGANATLHPRVVVGQGATVGSNSMVIRSVSPLTSVVGVPARVVSRPA